MIRLIAIVAATLAISAGAAMAAESDGGVFRGRLPNSMPMTNSAGSSSEPMQHELPMRAIVSGHNVQPRDDRMKALGYSDLTAEQAADVDRLYRQLIQKHVGVSPASS